MIVSSKSRVPRDAHGEKTMIWTAPKIEELAVGMEVSAYLAAEL